MQLERKSNKLLQVLASTVVLVIEPRRQPRPYFCSFRLLHVLKWGLLFLYWGSNSGEKGARVRVTLRLPVYRQSVRLGNKPLETQDQ
jgi:hypothetical protein